ncbi:MAG: hypothetical protein JO051_05460 [Acidobacteriaceae bacterium]|nr:hypothetical protein [Acidobacteriaceae bacterium]
MFERYTEKARRVIFFARYEGSQFGATYIETEHLLLGLLREDKALANRFVGPFDVIESIRKQIQAQTPPREKVSTSVDMPLSHESKRVLAYGSEEAERLGHQHIGTEHLFLGLMREEQSFAAEILRQRGLTLSMVREQIARGGFTGNIPIQFSRDLIQSAAEGKLNPPDTSDSIVNRVIEILWRQSKNSPVLIGDDAATKTAVIERLAVRIANGDVPDFFRNKRIYAVDVSQFVAERAHSSAPEWLFSSICAEFAGNRNAILFLDADINTLFNVRPDSRGVVRVYVDRAQCICSATAAEYREWIDSDPQLRPHFEAVEVAGPPENKASAQSRG